MKTLENVDKLIELIRLELIKQSELDSNRVLNSASLYGTDLDKILENNITESIELPDTTILYELVAKESTANVSEEEGEYYNSLDLRCSPDVICSQNTLVGDFIIDKDISYYKMFKLKVIIYGSDSSDVALKLCSRLRSGKVRTDLYSNGIYIEKVTDPITINEFKNNTMWLRNDIDIDLGIKLIINQVEINSDFSDINKTTIKEVE